MSISVKIEELRQGKPQISLLNKTFPADELYLGRSKSNEIVLDASDVSGKHAQLLIKPKGENGSKALYIVDIDSFNGTYLDETKLKPGKLYEVRKGQRIIVGRYLITSSIKAEKAPAHKVIETNQNIAESSEYSVPERVDSPLPSIEYEEEIKVRRTIRDQLIERLDLRRKDIVQLSEEDLRMRAQEVVERVLVDLRWNLPQGLTRESLIKGVLDEALGLGPLEELLSDEEVSEIMVNSYKQIYAERSGRLLLTQHRFSSEAAVLAAIERILAPIGRRVDESSPMVDARLKDGSRVNAVIRPLALQGPCITIRKFAKEALTIKKLVDYGSISRGMAEFLELAVQNRLNIVVSGGTGSGKTTLLNIISSFIPQHERVITVEDAAELRLPQEHVVKFETRPPNLENKGAVTIRDLVKNALRMRPDRIVIGECRGAEALDMLQAMNTGHDGSMTTGHANSPADIISRLETMVLTSGLDLPVRAIREQISSAVDLVIQQTRFSCGTRLVSRISEVVGMDYDEGIVILEDVFTFEQDGYDADGLVRGRHQATGYVPKFFRKLQERGLSVNANVFSPSNGAV